MKELEEISKLLVCKFDIIYIIHFILFIISNVQKLHDKIMECKDYAIQLSKSEEKVKELERKLKERAEEHRLVSISRKQLSDYSKLEQLNTTLAKENEVLK